MQFFELAFRLKNLKTILLDAFQHRCDKTQFFVIDKG